MTDKRRKAIEQGERAKQLYENEAFRDAMAGLRAAIHERWETAPLADRDGAHELRLMLKLSYDLEANIKRLVDDGKLAAIEIEREQKAATARQRR